MTYYRLAGGIIFLPLRIKELERFVVANSESNPPLFEEFCEQTSFASETYWMRGVRCDLEAWHTTSNGILLRIVGGPEFYVTANGAVAAPVSVTRKLTDLDLFLLLGPALVFALALRGVWSFHASAVFHKGKTILFVGESGMGKSTLAAYLSKQDGYQRVADDILPASFLDDEIRVLPHFPQLKLPPDDQPGIKLPESLRLDALCVLRHADTNDEPAIHFVPPSRAVQDVLKHIAGARMFDERLLAGHLAFSAEVAKQVKVYHLTYPHRRDALEKTKGLIEELC